MRICRPWNPQSTSPKSAIHILAIRNAIRNPHQRLRSTMRPLLVATILLASVVAGVSVAAKGMTVKLVISGGTLAAPVEIAGKDVEFANPWGDQVVHQWRSIPAPPGNGGRYEISF
jgi:hypothetical protein